MVGGTGAVQAYGDASIRTYEDLPDHNMIFFTIYVLILDGWSSSDSFSLKFDDIEVEFEAFPDGQTSFPTNACREGSERVGFQTTLQGKIPHEGSQLTFKLINKVTQDLLDRYLGFRSVSLLFATVPVASRTTKLCGDLRAISHPNNCLCPEGSYYDGADCIGCDPACRMCLGPSRSDCVICATDYMFNGTHCIKCHLSCEECFGETVNECTKCKSDKFLIDTSCVDACNYPLIDKHTDPKTCESPCPSEKFIAPNRECLDTCDYPLAQNLVSTKQLCISNCVDPMMLDNDNECTLSCDYPRAIFHNGPFEICGYPCQPGQIAYYNNTCLPLPCSSPFMIQVFNDYEVCVLSCANANNFIYWDETCHSTCPYPLIAEQVNDYQVCQVPNCDNSPCETCSTDADCPVGYYCNIGIGGVCLRLTSYTLRSGITKTILNGYIIRVEVVPLIGIPEGTDDVLDVLAMILVVNDDFTIDVQKVSKGIFIVTFEIFDTLQIDKIPIYFTYAPGSLDLKSKLEMPKVPYISPGLQEAAQIVKTGSIVSFGLLAVSTVGFAMTGGLGSLWSFLPENQYTYYLIYLNINYPYHSKTYFRSLANYDDDTHPSRVAWHCGYSI